MTQLNNFKITFRATLMKNKFNMFSLKAAVLSAAILVVGSMANAQQPQNNNPAQGNNRQTPPAIRRGNTATNNNNARGNTNAKTKGVNQNPTGAAPAIPFDKSPNGLNFQDAAADLLIMDYAMRTGRLVVKDPATPAPLITLRSTPESPLTDEEYLLAIESVLNLNGIALEKDGDKFLKVFPSTEFHRRGIKGDVVTDVTKKEAILPENGSFVTRTIRLNYITIDEAKAIVEGFVRTGSQIQTFERDNSFRITDSVENVNRIIEMLSYLDKPIPALEETSIIKIQYAKATEIKERLMEIVTDAQESQEKNKNAATERTSGAPGTYGRPLPPGAGVPGNRWNRNQPQQQDNKSTGNAAIDAAVAEAQRGIIRGKVSIFADERTNMLIIITRKENMVFFNKIIEELDIPTAPDVLAEVIRLEHAIAEDIAELLNDLIDNAKKDSSDSKVRRDDTTTNNNNNNRTTTKTNTSANINSQMVGQLDSENIKILSDERTNSLLIMAPAADMTVIKNIIKNVDIMLSQVVIETAIVSVKFTDSTETGMNWVQGVIKDLSDDVYFATSGGGGDYNSGDNSPKAPNINATDFSRHSLTTGGANLILSILDLELDVILRAIQKDTRSRLLSSPRITTQDNKEAILESTERIYWREGTTYYDDSDRSSDNIKNEDIGIKLTVTPRINKKGFINLTIEQEMQTNEGYSSVTGASEKYPLLTTRKMGADVAVQSGETVVLGGLAQNQITVTQSKVPILGSIPLLGRLFRSESEENTRTEIIVFITPRVIDSPAQIEDDARKVRATLDTEGVWDSGWSYSRLADQKTEEDRKTYIENSRKTVEKPNTPLSGYLTNTNEENGFDNPAKDKTTNPDGTETKLPYIHFTEAEKLRALPNGVVLPTQEVKQSQSENTDSAPAEPTEEAPQSEGTSLDKKIDTILEESPEN